MWKVFLTRNKTKKALIKIKNKPQNKRQVSQKKIKTKNVFPQNL